MWYSLINTVFQLWFRTTPQGWTTMPTYLLGAHWGLRVKGTANGSTFPCFHASTPPRMKLLLLEGVVMMSLAIVSVQENELQLWIPEAINCENWSDSVTIRPQYPSRIFVLVATFKDQDPSEAAALEETSLWSVGGSAGAARPWGSGNHNWRGGGSVLGLQGVQKYVLAWNSLGVSLVLSVSCSPPHAKGQGLLNNYCPRKGTFSPYLVTKKLHSDLRALWMN